MTDDSSMGVRFYYSKSQIFRVIHADGALGGITPRGLIHVVFYSERPAIPQSQFHSVSPEGRLSEPVSTEGKDGVVRELDVDVMMSKTTAIELRDWLTARIDELESLTKTSTERRENQNV
jgi:hypothetical protein